MSSSFDENLGNREAARLQQAGHYVDGTRIVPQLDVHQTLIEVCGRERCCLVTLDLDFGNQQPAAIRSAFLCRHRCTAPVQTIDRERVRRTHYEAALSSGSIDGKLWVVELGRVREYAPDGP